MAQSGAQSFAPHVSRSQKSLPRTSVGPVDNVPTTIPLFLSAVRAGAGQYVEKPFGFSNSGNFCYRNAILRMLISSQRFTSYVRNWHLNMEVIISIPTLPSVAINLLSLIGGIAGAAERQLSPSLPFRAPDQVRVDSAVEVLWRVTCDMSVDSVPPPTQNNKNGTTTNATVIPAAPPVTQVPLGGSNVWNYNTRSRHGQHDAHEWLIWLIGSIHSQLRTFPRANLPRTPRGNFESLLYRNQLNRWVCSNCRFKVRRRNASTIESCLGVSFPAGTHTKTFQELKTPICLQRLVNETYKETIDDVTCTRCKNKDSPKKRYSTIQHTPEVLLVNLQRPTYNENGASKIMQAVSIPEYLDLTPFLDPHQFGVDSIAKYRLSSVVSHIGASTDIGHYVCFARVGKRYNKWYEFNDAHVALCRFEDFDDTSTESMDLSKFTNRATPYVMLYELDDKKSNQVNGRKPMNPDQGDTADTKPATYYSLRVPRTQLSPVLDLPGDEDIEHLGLMLSESSAPRAELRVAIKLDNQVFELPKSFIEHFDLNTKRLVEIKATIVGSDGNQTQEIDLAQAYSDAVANLNKRREAGVRKPRLLKPPGRWSDRWRISKR